MAANPGLTLEALPEDTIAVANVPLSLNGWGVIARFAGPGGTVDTEPAFLFVGDYVNAYRSVIDGYRAAYASGRQDDIGYLFDNIRSEMAAYSAGDGYALKDLDKNGVPELLIAGIDPVYPEYSKAIYDVYTLDGHDVEDLDRLLENPQVFKAARVASLPPTDVWTQWEMFFEGRDVPDDLVAAQGCSLAPVFSSSKP